LRGVGDEGATTARVSGAVTPQRRTKGCTSAGSSLRVLLVGIVEVAAVEQHASEEEPATVRGRPAVAMTALAPQA
jgi:hypothetical protein